MSYLTKWPRLIVVPEKPEPVTREQANEILLRTNGSFFSVNDREWEKQVCDVLGIETEWKPYKDGGGYWDASWKSGMAWYESIGGLELHYLENSQIASAWIGGPHGWCDWDGNIGCSSWNIGKWPEAEEVTEDWEKIAAAFPYLDLHAQCVTDEGDGEVAAQWRVTDGKAALVKPIGRFPSRDLGEGQMLARILGRHGERGVSLERLKEATGQVSGDSKESS
jgi:hypothetical protein